MIFQPPTTCRSILPTASHLCNPSVSPVPRLGMVVMVLLGAAMPAAAQQAYYIHVDHLNTPRLIANQGQQTVWRWDNDDPFGVNMANANPSGLGTFAFNLRLPGQYFDSETNYHYNYFRDYSPEIGRYAQSDPTGLEGGLNTFDYVEGSPVAFSDPLGLAKGGKKNISTEGFSKKSPPSEVEAAMNAAKKNGQQARYKALRGLLKVIKRGGTMGLACILIDRQLQCEEDPCSCDPDSLACILDEQEI